MRTEENMLLTYFRGGYPQGRHCSLDVSPTIMLFVPPIIISSLACLVSILLTGVISINLAAEISIPHTHRPVGWTGNRAQVAAPGVHHS